MTTIQQERDSVFRTMFWHEATYRHQTETLPDGWRCLGCDAKMSANPSPQGRSESK